MNTALDYEILLDSPDRYLKLEDSNLVAVDSSDSPTNGTHGADDQDQQAALALANEPGVGIAYNGVSARTTVAIPRPVYPWAIELLFVNPIQAAAPELIVTVESGQANGMQLNGRKTGEATWIQSSHYDQFNSRTINSSPGNHNFTSLTHVVSKAVSANRRELYIDGDLVGFNTQSITLGLDDWFILIGWNGVTSSFTGTLGRVAYYTAYDLTADRIAAHHRAALVSRGGRSFVSINADDLEEIINGG